MTIHPVSWLDIAFYATFLIPNIILQLSLHELIILLGLAVPYVSFVLPYQLAYDRWTSSGEWTVWENVVLRMVRFAFANLSYRIGQVFFSEKQAFPFTRFRTNNQATRWREKVSKDGFEGYWIWDPLVPPPKTVIFYLHGGGFTMGSTAFYFEFLMHIIEAIPGHQARVFSLEYPLVPTSIYPSQLAQIAKAYEYLLTVTSADNIILVGDSAGAALQLSLLFHIARPCPNVSPPSKSLPVPKAVVLLSPWCHTDSTHNGTCRLTGSIDEDFLTTEMLNEYARLYSGASPSKPPPPLWYPLQFWWEASKRCYRQFTQGNYTTKWLNIAKSSLDEVPYLDTKELARHSEKCKSPYINPFASLAKEHEAWLSAALPSNILIIYGLKEMMAGDISEFARGLEKVINSRGSGKVEVMTRWKKGWHVWPLVLMYLGQDTREAESGVNLIAEYISRVIGIDGISNEKRRE